MGYVAQWCTSHWQDAVRCRNLLGGDMETKRIYCIVTKNDKILAKDLSLGEADEALRRFINLGEDCWIGETVNYTQEKISRSRRKQYRKG